MLDHLKRVLTALAACLMAVGLCGCGSQETRDKYQLEVEREKVGVRLVGEVLRGDYNLLTVAELKAKMDHAQDMVIVDTMPFESSYSKNHIPGAVQFLFPIPDMHNWDDNETGGRTKGDFERVLGPDKNRPVVVYCGFVACTRSHNGAAWARRLGYTNVYRVPGGIFAWRGAGYEFATR